MSELNAFWGFVIFVNVCFLSVNHILMLPSFTGFSACSHACNAAGCVDTYSLRKDALHFRLKEKQLLNHVFHLDGQRRSGN